MTWTNFLLAGDAETEVEAATVLTLAGDLVVTGAGKSITAINYEATAATELTIASGSVTRTQFFHRIDTEADAASDDLDQIVGGQAAMMLLIRPENDARTVVVKHNVPGAADADNILLSNGSDYTMDNISDMLLLMYDATIGAGSWVEVARGSGGVASLTSTTPEPTDGTAGAAGNDGDAARADHIHALGPLVADLDFNSNNALSFVLENSSAAPDSGSEQPGQLYYDTDDDRPKIWVA